MGTPNAAFLSMVILLVSQHLVTCHKTQFRVLGLQYATLNQRFELETRILHEEVASANTDIQDLKADNNRIIQMFEVFTTEVKELKAALAHERLKFQSLETDFKTFQGRVEEFKVKCQDNLLCEETKNITKEYDMSSQEPGESKNDDHKTSYQVFYDYNGEDGVFNKGREITRAGPQSSAKASFSSNKDASLFVAKYGEMKACLVNLITSSINSCVSHLGDGVRALAVDTDKETLYWSDDNRKSVLSSALNGSDVSVVARDVTTLGIGLDASYQVLFYTNVSGDVFRKSLDVNTGGSVWTNVGEKPRRIYLDQGNKLIYAITNQWTGIVTINYATDRREMVVEAQGRIKALTVDSKNQILYFSVNSSIYVKDLVDKATFAILHGTSIPSDLIIYGEHMYIVYYYLNKIDVMDLKTRVLTNTIYIPWEGRGNTVSMCLIQAS